jgi:hypothetical protein
MSNIFTITQIENGYLISYYAEHGHVQRFFQDIKEVIYILENVLPLPKQELLSNKRIG